MRGRPMVVRLTHEFIEDPAGVRRAYDAWALLLARSLNLNAEEERTITLRVKPRRGRAKKGTA